MIDEIYILYKYFMAMSSVFLFSILSLAATTELIGYKNKHLHSECVPVLYLNANRQENMMRKYSWKNVDCILKCHILNQINR